MRGIVCLLILLSVPVRAAAGRPFASARLYVLNSSDYLFNRLRKQIARSRRYRGRYYKRFPFRTLLLAEYYLKEGENLHTVSTSLGISVDSIASASGIVFFYETRPGQRLVIPNFEGVVYRTRKGCSLSWLARRYHVPLADIRRFNRISGNYLRPGRWVFLPGAAMLAREQALFYGTAFGCPLANAAISSRFGFRRDPKNGRYAFHGGLDLAAPRWTPVFAAHEGTVEYCGWAGGYGRLVVLRHAFGYRTFYGHLAKILVRPGQQVGRKTMLGRVGSSGYSTGPHLHFEIRHYKKKLDPQRYTALRHQARSRAIMF